LPDVIIEATINIFENDRHNDRYDQKPLWFKLSCTGDLACNLDNFKILGVREYDIRSKNNKPLSDSLVPIINREQLEETARDFLERYYSEALREPMAIEPAVLAERMKLSIDLKHITSDFSVFGQVFFADCEVEYYDKGTSSYVKTQVAKGTMFVDPDAYYLRNLGSVNNTIVHECVHWDKHRKAFELERLYNESATQIKCQVVGGIKDSAANTSSDWMEWHANALTPRMQMPYTQAKVKAEELICKYKQQLNNLETIDVMEYVIDEMATFFCVSRCAAKIRMIDLGYEEAIGTFTYIDGKYIKPHGFKKGYLQKNQTFSISVRDAVVESFLRPELKQSVKNGTYLFVESHFCINDPKYITEDENGYPCLTDYARHNMDECCLVFDLSVKSNTNAYGKQFYTECILFRDASSDIIFEASYVHSDKNQTVAEKAAAIAAYNKEILEVIKQLPGSFGGTLAELIKWCGTTNEKLGEASLLSARTIQRLRNADDEYESSLETVIALCIGLQLPPILSSNLMEKSGFSLKNTQQHLMYDFILTSCYSYPISYCNDLLTAQGFPMLSGTE